MGEVKRPQAIVLLKEKHRKSGLSTRPFCFGGVLNLRNVYRGVIDIK